MKKQIKHFQKFALLLLFGLLANTSLWAVSGPSFNLVLKNDTQVTSKIYEFDVYLLNTTPATYFELSSIQMGILFNTGILNGGTISASIVAGSQTDIPAGQQQTASNMSVVGPASPTKTVKVTSKTTSAGSGAIVLSTGSGSRIMRIRMTNTVDFAQAKPNLTFSYTTSGPSWSTIVNAYVNAVSTNINANGVFIDNASGVNSQLNNPTLNAPTGPTVFNVTGGGNYCTSGSPVVVSLSGSQSNYSYQLYKDAVASGSPVTGTGSAMNFNATAAGTYTVGVVSPATAMTGNAVVTVTTALTPSVSIGADQNNLCGPSSVTFTATPTNGGTPVYQWKVNGSNVGTNSASYSYTPANNDVVTCVMTSSLTCVTSATATSNGVTMTVNTPAVASVSIGIDHNNVCEGDMISFTATPTNGGLPPTYQWKINNVNASTGDNLNIHAYNGDVVKCIMTAGSGCISGSPATSNTITVSTTAPVTPSVSIDRSANGVCGGTSVDFTATPTNGGTAAYQWKVNGSNVGTNSATYSYTPADGDVVTCVLTSSLTCVTSSTANSNSLTMNITTPVAASVSIDRSANNVCAGTSIDFTATPTNGGTPAYQWKVNGSNVGSNSASYSYAPVDGDVVTCVMTSTATCATGSPATSNSLTMGINGLVTPSVNIEATFSNVCAGTSVDFTATPINGGTPAYQWKVNGSNVGSNSASYSYTPANNDAISCVMTSSLTCVNNGGVATSNNIVMTVNTPAAVSVSIGASINPVNQGDPVTFTATPTNGGVSPAYQWKVNGSNVGTNNASYSYTPANNDQVSCVMTSNASCISGSPATSNTISMSVNPALPVSVSINASSNPVCTGTSVTYTATPTNGGNGPVYQWKVNGSNVGSNSATYSYVPVNNDVVTCVLTSNATPVSGNPATSNGITMTVNSIIHPTVTVTPSATGVTSGTQVTYTATVQQGFTPAQIRWYVNSTSTLTNNLQYTYAPANSDWVFASLTFTNACAGGSNSNQVNVSVVSTAPTVTTGAPVNNVYTSVKLTGYVNNTGGDPAVERGFVYSYTTNTPLVGGIGVTKVVCDSAGYGSFAQTIATTPNVCMWYRAYAKNAMGTSYGVIVTLNLNNTTNFTGTGNWSTAARWSNGVPTGASAAFIQGACTQDVDGSCYSLGVYPTASLSIPSGKTLNVNQWALIYSYATGTGAIVNLGTFNVSTANSSLMRRYAVGSKSHLVSSPLNNAKSSSFSGAYLYPWVNGAYGSSISTGTVSLGVGYGYQLYPSTSSTYQFSGGVFNHTDVSMTSAYLKTGYNLVGNPFPCRLNVGNFSGWNLSATDASILVYDPTLNQYCSWNGTTGTNGFNGILAENQGFFVNTTTALASFTIPASGQVVGSANTFKRAIVNQIRLGIRGNNASDEMVVNFNTESNAGKIFANTDAPCIFSVNKENNLSINSLSELNSNVSIPVGIKVSVSGNYQITAKEMESFAAGTEIYLEDLQTKKLINLNEQDAYTFTANASDNSNRFILHFGKPTAASSAINAYSYNSTLYINNPSLVKINEVAIYNALGQKVTSFVPETNSLTQYDLNVATGNYIVKVVTENNVVSTKVNLK